MGEYNIKLGFFSKKSGNVISQEVFDNNGNSIGKYSGDIYNGIMHGNGEIIISTEMKSQVKRDSFLYNHIVKESITYNGEWKNGLFDGNGKWEKQQITYEKQVKDFSNNIISISNLTYTYDGEWKNGVKQGYGDYKEYKEIDGSKIKLYFYKGEWTKDMKNGKGLLTKFHGSGGDSDITKYDGEFKNGNFTKGVESRNSSKTKFEYEINEDNCFVGSFFVTDGNKNLFEFEVDGNEVDYTFSCKGNIKFNNGAVFEGEFKNYNKFYLSNTSDISFRKGIYTDETNGIVIKGTFIKGGCLDGNVNIAWKNGDKFDGVYKNDIRISGVYLWANGQKYCGEYNKDKKEHGKGRMDYPDGSYYEGNWENGKKHGDGKLYDSNGFIEKMGNWVNDDFIDTTISDKISLD